MFRRSVSRVFILLALAQTASAVDLPCNNIEKACEAAVYKKQGNEPGQGLLLSCMQPTLNGVRIPNVSVSSADIEACNLKRQSLKK